MRRDYRSSGTFQDKWEESGGPQLDERIVKAYERFKDEPGFTRVAALEEIRAKDGNLSIPLYAAPSTAQAQTKTEPSGSNLEDSLSDWLKRSCANGP